MGGVGGMSGKSPLPPPLAVSFLVFLSVCVSHCHTTLPSPTAGGVDLAGTLSATEILPGANAAPDWVVLGPDTPWQGSGGILAAGKS